VGDVLSTYVGDRGWQTPLNEGRLFGAWDEIVGSDVAAHCSPVALRDRELRVMAESTAWATELRRLSGTLLARIAAEVGPEMVTRLAITGPTAPSWKHGRWSVQGARGPRDTYG
jgi:predicted nucleic acid-binding Zn ribbon protein